MDRNFQVGSFCFHLLYPDNISLPLAFMKFETAQSSFEYTYELKVVQALPEPEGLKIASRPDLIVFSTATGENRMIGTRANRFYAYYKETAADRAIVLIAEDQLSFLQWDTGFISLLALERRMAGRDCLILHCAYIRYQQEALLFSAPSETGKSTQANLWEKYRGSETVNGDRALLTKADGHWVAQGWPICGSSEICENISAPIRAIVTLSQEKENRASVIHPAEAFMSIYPQITVNSWDRECITNSLNLTEALLKEVPVYHLGCTISEEAVNCLNEILYPD